MQWSTDSLTRLGIQEVITRPISEYHSLNFLEGIAKYEGPKSWYWEGQNSGPIFSVYGPKFTKLGVQLSIYWSDRGLQCHFLIDDILFQSGDIRDQVAKLSEIAPKFWARGKVRWHSAQRFPRWGFSDNMRYEISFKNVLKFFKLISLM